uniref:Uncharacterized protein n=1 Tax=Macaca fascicularis TaxID=9541 RepID=A0A7N9CEC8_MACFA
AYCCLRLPWSSFCASASRVDGITGAHHHTQLIFVLLVETGFCCVGQAGLELLTSSDPPALASRSAKITGMSHHTRSGHEVSLPSTVFAKSVVCAEPSMLVDPVESACSLEWASRSVLWPRERSSQL